MELDEMKTLWEGMSQELEKQKLLTDKIIIEMTQEKFNSRIQTISKFESFGAIMCFIMAFFILFNIESLDKWYLIASGWFSIAYLIILPSLVLYSIKRMRGINILSYNVKEAAIEFAQRKKQFLNLQKWGIGLNFIFVILALPIAAKIMDGKDLFATTGVWLWYVPIAFVALFFFSRWGFKHYVRLTMSAQNMLDEVNEN